MLIISYLILQAIATHSIVMTIIKMWKYEKLNKGKEMTFDEARRYLIGNFEDMNLEAVISIINNLREEYAPTIEMTKEQKEYYGSRTLLSGMSFLGNTRYYTDDVHNIPREIAMAILHPETIKVVDK